MSQLDEILKNYDVGNAIFEKLFALSDKKLREKLQSICKHTYIDIPDRDFILKDGRIQRTIVDEKPDEIMISNYDSISLGAFGITYHPEHGLPEKFINFDEHFKL